MKTILDTIAEKTRLRVEQVKSSIAVSVIKDRAVTSAQKQFSNGMNRQPSSFLFEQAITMQGISFICEVKKASPSKGIIAEDFPYLEIAEEYETAGAAAISVLTEPDYFLGKNEYLREIAAAVSIPVLRKDFIIDSYQIYEAKTLGASAVLLICALLNSETLSRYITIAHELGMSALVEAHNEAEVHQALQAGARIIGINNRDLKTFTVNLGNTAHLRNLIPAHIPVIAESGIKSAEDIRTLKAMNISAVLIGESLMRAENKKRLLDELKGACNEN